MPASAIARRGLPIGIALLIGDFPRFAGGRKADVDLATSLSAPFQPPMKRLRPLDRPGKRSGGRDNHSTEMGEKDAEAVVALSFVKPWAISVAYSGRRIVEDDMKRKPILLFAFPALMLLILAGERAATFLLGTYPASPAMWRIWLELRPLATMFWQQVDLYLGASIALDAAMLASASMICWMACRARGPAAFFLANHVALLFAGLMIVAGSQSETASTIAGFTAPSGISFSLAIDFTVKNSLVLMLGAAACAYCHVAFLSEARQRAEGRAICVLALQRDF